MNIFRLPHKHLNPETLAEYLDGRLAGTAIAQVNQRLTSCATCREEMESLRTTVSLLKQLPQIVPTRSFTMATPPPQPALPQPSPLFRMPQWAYAGAASAAAVVLAVLISADATGVLATKRIPVAQPAPKAAQLERLSAVQERSVTRATIPEFEAPESEAAEAEKPAAAPVQQAMQAETAATPREALTQALGVEKDASAQAPLAAQAPSPLEAGPSEPITAEAKARPPAQTTLTMETPALQPPQASPGATSWLWRVFEVLAAASLMALLAGMIIRRRWSRRGFWY